MKLTLGYFQRMAITVMLLSLPHFGSAQLVNITCIDGTVSPSQSVCPGTQPTDLVLTANTGAVIKWQSSLNPDFSEPTDIDVTASVLSGNTIGAIMVTTYFRAVVQSGTCSFSASGYAMVSIKAVAPNPGSLSRFTLFTAVGAVSNTGITNIQGDVGTNSGDITGFEAPSAINGTIQNANVVTAQAISDVNTLYTTLYSTPATNSHIPVFGNGETLFGGVYAIQEAASVAGNLTLDAQGDPDRVFIFRALGAFTTVAGTTVTLTNGATASNIFWVADGAITISASTNIKGILVANGSISIGTAAILNGQMYSTGGVVTTSANSITPASPIGGVLSGGATICSSAETVLTLSGYNGSIVKWQSSTVSDFSSNISDISNTAATFTAPPITESTWFRAVIDGSGCTEERYSETAALIVASTVWNGASWSNGMPGPTTALIFNASFVATQDIDACTVLVTNNAVVNVPTGFTVTVNGAVTVTSGSFMIENNAALVQLTDAVNSGNITIIKKSNALYRLDYTLWSSPVSGTTLGDFSPLTVPTRYYEYGFNGTAEYYLGVPASSAFAAAKGYLIRMPDTDPTLGAGYYNGEDPMAFTGTFTGTPNNGTVTIPASVVGNRFTAVGNPYPSPISVEAFFNGNEGIVNEASGLYFWRKKNNGDASSYATLTLAAFTANDGFDNDPVAGGGEDQAVFFPGNDTDSWLISQGQGFIVKTAANPTGSNITFTNAMRRPSPGADQAFFRTSELNNSRYWLNLTTGDEGFSQVAVAYMDNATFGLDYGYDGRQFSDGGGVTLYSLAEETRLSIQARPEFTSADVVPLGFKVSNAGEFTMSLDHMDGLFEQGQDIYLKDNLLSVYHDLGESSYTFTSEAGTFNDRFEVVYTTHALGTKTPQLDPNSVMVYKQGNTININSGTAEMTGVTIYDIRGRKLYSNDKINATKTAVNNLKVAQEVLIVEINTVKGKVSKRIVF